MGIRVSPYPHRLSARWLFGTIQTLTDSWNKTVITTLFRQCFLFLSDHDATTTPRPDALCFGSAFAKETISKVSSQHVGKLVQTVAKGSQGESVCVGVSLQNEVKFRALLPVWHVWHWDLEWSGLDV